MSIEFRPPPTIDRLLPEAVAAIADTDLEHALIAYVTAHAAIKGDRPSHLANWPLAIQVWYVAWVLDAEVLNGGFNQFFFNRPEWLVSAAPAALTAVGAPDAAKLIARARALLDSHASTLEAAREAGTLEAFADTYLQQPFAELDRLYSEGAEQWRSTRIQYLRREAHTLRHP